MLPGGGSHVSALIHSPAEPSTPTLLPRHQTSEQTHAAPSRRAYAPAKYPQVTSANHVTKNCLLSPALIPAHKTVRIKRFDLKPQKHAGNTDVHCSMRYA